MFGILWKIYSNYLVFVGWSCYDVFETTFASDCRTFCSWHEFCHDMMPHDSPWFALIRRDSSECFPNLQFPGLLSELQLHHPPDAPHKLRWSSRTVEPAGTVSIKFLLFLCSRRLRMQMVCHLCQRTFQGFEHGLQTNRNDQLQFRLLLSSFTQIIDSHKTKCITSLPSEQSEQISWMLLSSTRPKALKAIDVHIVSLDLLNSLDSPLMIFDINWYKAQCNTDPRREDRRSHKIEEIFHIVNRAHFFHILPPRARPPCRPSARAEATALRFAWRTSSWQNKPEEQIQKDIIYHNSHIYIYIYVN